jgi:N-methylhydantoinase B/oxoprolinase/acetone carboxylase alpha subunit
MVLLKTTGEKIDLANTGHMPLQRGDVLTVLSPGGGGYGAKS